MTVLVYCIEEVCCLNFLRTTGVLKVCQLKHKLLFVLKKDLLRFVLWSIKDERFFFTC